MQHTTNQSSSAILPHHLSAENKEAAMARLLMSHKDQLFYTAYLLVKDRYIAEDIFQEAFIRALRSMRNGQYVDEGKFVAWAARIVRNLAIDHIRQNKSKKKVTLANGNDIFDFLASGNRNKEEQLELKNMSETVREGLTKIPYEQREVVVLRIYGELSFKEIAELTDCGINTVLGRMRYGLLNLKKLVKKNNLVL